MHAVICFAVLAIALPAAAQEDIAALEGGWSKADIADPNVVAAAKFALDETQPRNMKATLDDVVEARQQLVSGMNYWIRMHVTDRASGKPVEWELDVLMYQDWDNIYSMTSWSWKRNNQGGMNPFRVAITKNETKPTPRHLGVQGEAMARAD